MPNYNQEMPKSELLNPPTLVRPASPTPNHTLYLSNLDDHRFFRFNLKYVFLFRSSPDVAALRFSLSSILVPYYPLAGRLRAVDAAHPDKSKLIVDCTGDGAIFAEASIDVTSDDFLHLSRWPNPSWRTLIYRPPGAAFLDLPILLVQATHLRCGGMILAVGMNHCLCDGFGTSQFMNAWADMCRDPTSPIAVPPCWGREALKPRVPLQVRFTHPEFEQPEPESSSTNDRPTDSAEPLVPVSITIGPETILRLKRLCAPSIKCTTFEVLTAHVWRCWARSMGRKSVKLLFTADIRARLDPPLPTGYYGDAIVLGCAECDSETIVHGNSISQAVKAVQAAKATTLTDEHVRSVVDLLEERRALVDLSSSLVVTQWSRLGLDRVDFGTGRPQHVGPISSEVHCVLLPVVGMPESVTVLVSMPKSRSHRFECYMREIGEMDGPIEVRQNCPLYPVQI